MPAAYLSRAYTYLVSGPITGERSKHHHMLTVGRHSSKRFCVLAHLNLRYASCSRGYYDPILHMREPRSRDYGSLRLPSEWRDRSSNQGVCSRGRCIAAVADPQAPRCGLIEHLLVPGFRAAFTLQVLCAAAPPASCRSGMLWELN